MPYANILWCKFDLYNIYNCSLPYGWQSRIWQHWWQVALNTILQYRDIAVTRLPGWRRRTEWVVYNPSLSPVPFISPVPLVLYTTGVTAPITGVLRNQRYQHTFLINYKFKNVLVNSRNSISKSKKFSNLSFLYNLTSMYWSEPGNRLLQIQTLK